MLGAFLHSYRSAAKLPSAINLAGLLDYQLPTSGRKELEAPSHELQTGIPDVKLVISSHQATLSQGAAPSGDCAAAGRRLWAVARTDDDHSHATGVAIDIATAAVPTTAAATATTTTATTGIVITAVVGTILVAPREIENANTQIRCRYAKSSTYRGGPTQRHRLQAPCRNNLLAPPLGSP